MSESLHNLATAYVAKGRTNEFEKMNDYILKLTEKMSTMEKIGHRILKERLGTSFTNFYSWLFFKTMIIKYYSLLLAYLHDLQHIQPALDKWSESEPDLVQALQAIGSASSTCSDSEIKLIDKHRQNISVVFIHFELIRSILRFTARFGSLGLILGFYIWSYSSLVLLKIVNVYISFFVELFSSSY